MADAADPSALRRAVWSAFAEHFLDTETRHELPRAALAAVEAGLTVEEARDVWTFEVMPAVGGNLLEVAGEWAGWDEAWLLERISRMVRRRQRRPRAFAALAERLAGRFRGTSWGAIEALMRALLAAAPAARPALAADLTALARHHFDLGPQDLALHVPGRREHLASLYRTVFLPAFAPTVAPGAGESAAELAARVERALA